jgi:hypothetical protein
MTKKEQEAAILRMLSEAKLNQDSAIAPMTDEDMRQLRSRRMTDEDMRQLSGATKQSAGNWSGLKKLIMGDEAVTDAPSGVLEHLDAYTGAPARSAISKLQDDFTDLPGAARAYAEQFGEKPTKAPSGADLAKKMQLEGIPAAVAGTALELAADPSSAITGGLKLASVPLIGLKALKAVDAAGDAAKVVKGVDTAADAARAVKAAETAASAAKTAGTAEDAARAIKAADTMQALSTKPMSASEQLIASAKAKRAEELAQKIKMAEEAKKEAGLEKLWRETVGESAAAAQQGPVLPAKPTRPTSLAETKARTDTVFDEIKGTSTADAIRNSKLNPVAGKHGGIIFADDSARLQRLRSKFKK